MKVNHKSENGTELTLKAFAHQKETLKERQGQPSEYKEIFAKEETQGIYFQNSSCSSRSKIHTNQERKKKRAKDQNGYFSEKSLQIADRHMKRCSASLMTREMQIKSPMR